MVCIFSKNDEPSIKIFECIRPNNEFDYFRPQGNITFSLDRKYNIPIVDIRFNGWYGNSVRLWSKHTEQIRTFFVA